MTLQTQISNLATAIGTNIKSLRVSVFGSAAGTLASLQTTDKTSIVAAINEARTTGGGAAAPAASETVAGIAEFATQTEVNTGTDDARIVTPLKFQTRLAAYAQPLAANLTSLAGQASTAFGRGLLNLADTAALKAAVSGSASETATGFIELATLAEVSTGTDTTRAVTAAGVRQERLAVKAEILGAATPAALDTLDELAAALGDDANFAATTTTALGNRVRHDTAAQGLTTTQQGNARTNIAAIAAADIGDPETDFVAVFNTALA
jgi:hypothetical protein